MAGVERVSESGRRMKRKQGERKWPKLGLGPQVVIVCLVIGLIGAMAIQPTRALLEQRRRIEGMSGDLRRMETLNAKLEDRIERLQDPDFIEQEAREKVGLVRQGETTYLVVPPTRKQQRKKARQESAPKSTEKPAPPEPGLIEGFLDFVGLG
jgi:cell division protein FtsB